LSINIDMLVFKEYQLTDRVTAIPWDAL